MKFNAEQFTEDLVIANSAAQEAADLHDDGGSANLDRAFVRIPRIRETKILQAIKDAGLYCSGRTQWLGSGYMIRPNVGGIGNKNTIAIKTFVEKLENAGYDVIAFHQMD
ncbi:hypothetical protein [Oceanobacillus kimchii]|uniref:Uncharacterized protein n=1 Tax=Oceanobacillus kimchii TaxID=746691 RepID=A0ABQ5TJ07_9BACI|nr:hypothetical protein [Oceanobacillus kimchii]GLO66271.1 hypothetical protein MACH08_20550 [Oceanobacillus kimchii]